MSQRHVHPWVFMILIVPFGAIFGFVSVAVGFTLTQAGVPVDRTAALIALGLLPHTWKFVWAPIADTTLTRKRWYVIASLLSAAGICATGAIRPDAAGLALLSAVVFTSNVAVTFLGMSVESLMAYGTPENLKGRAGGWFQAGNLGGQGIGGGAGLWLAQHLASSWIAAAIVAGACVACMFALRLVEEPESAHRHADLRVSLLHVGKDVWNVSRSRMGALALILCFLPIGSGAASNLWSAVASDWRASANTVAMVTGVLGGIVSAVGCVAGGLICDRMNRKTAYAAFGVLQAVCASAMALAPRTEATYVLFTLIYAFITGLTYAGFSAFVLEAMGLGAAATKYNLYASLSNMPIYYMTNMDGWAHQRWGPAGMLHFEAACGIAGLVAFGIVLALWPRARAGETAAAAPEPIG
ncbi:MAG TPA: MFS transporter [Candidatus Sulfotelmatobacter sp.]|nr:MFS transporter [Candidatus Sulfotelmatobacter sp.]